MHRICLAPVLSATLSRDSCWIICPVLLLRLLDDLHHAPALGRAERAGLHQEHPVTDATFVGLVVGLEPHRAAQDLAVERVLDAVLDGHDDGLVHLVADDEALADLAAVALDVGLTHCGLILLRLAVGRHELAPSSAASSRTRSEMPSSRSRRM